MTCYTHELMDEVLEQIAIDVANGDLTSIQELLMNVEAKYLESFLSEETLLALREKWNMDVPADYLL